MLKGNRLLILLLVLLAQPANADKVLVDYPNWPSIGKAKLSVLWFDIYEAELSSKTGFYCKDCSFKLTLTYLRDFEAEELIDETFNQISVPITEQQAFSWRQSLQQMWPDVTESDQISFVRTSDGTSQFFFNKSYVGTIKDTAFGIHFANIWLAKDSAYPKLAAKLKGEKK